MANIGQVCTQADHPLLVGASVSDWNLSNNLLLFIEENLIHMNNTVAI